MCNTVVTSLISENIKKEQFHHESEVSVMLYKVKSNHYMSNTFAWKLSSDHQK